MRDQSEEDIDLCHILLKIEWARVSFSMPWQNVWEDKDRVILALGFSPCSTCSIVFRLWRGRNIMAEKHGGGNLILSHQLGDRVPEGFRGKMCHAKACPSDALPPWISWLMPYSTMNSINEISTVVIQLPAQHHQLEIKPSIYIQTTIKLYSTVM